jgi:hypothetical protein
LDRHGSPTWPLRISFLFSRGLAGRNAQRIEAKTVQAAARANPAKVADFGDEDLLQDIELARILFGEVVPLRRDARWRSIQISLLRE